MKTIIDYPQFLSLSEEGTNLFIVKTETCKVCDAVINQLEPILEPYKELNTHIVPLERIPLFQGQQLIFTVPTILLFHSGKEVLRESRFIDYQRIQNMLDLLFFAEDGSQSLMSTSFDY
ncbi:MAG: thioredoxin family protein [Bacilli bacterium]|nr:thioredoxin family protein [Bacilli bacterium]